MSGNQEVAMHLLIEGRVQAVGFRYFVLTSVGDMKINGWVRNLQDGRVEVLAEGDKGDLIALLEKIQQGPSASRVDDTIINWELAIGDLKRFRMLASSDHSR